MNPLEQLAKQLAKAGAPILGGMIGGPGGLLAGKAIEILADTLGSQPTPAEVGAAAATNPTGVAQAEANAAKLLPLWMMEAQRASDAQAAEIAQGFTAWQVMRVAIQVVVWGMWPVIVLVGLFGGNWGVKTLVPPAELIGAWGTVTTVWMVVFHGGHTAKEVLPFMKFGRR
jgi:hypothetical protein